MMCFWLLSTSLNPQALISCKALSYPSFPTSWKPFSVPYEAWGEPSKYHPYLYFLLSASCFLPETCQGETGADCDISKKGESYLKTDLGDLQKMWREENQFFKVFIIKKKISKQKSNHFMKVKICHRKLYLWNLLRSVFKHKDTHLVEENITYADE